MFDAAPDTPNALRDNRHSAVACAQVKRAPGAARRVSAKTKPAVKAKPAAAPKPPAAAAPRARARQVRGEEARGASRGSSPFLSPPAPQRPNRTPRRRRPDPPRRAA